MNRAVRVTVPATSANLGPGFDALGLALDLHDVIEAHTVPAEPGGSLTVAVEGFGADDLPRDASHLVVQAMHVVFKLAGQEPPAIDLRCVNGIPHGRGLGSSAAAIVAGVLAARALVDGGPDLVDDEAVLAVAAGLEGHPDNVAPCLLGGLTLAWNPGERARAIRLDVHPDLRPVLCVPEQTLPTEAARGLLPERRAARGRLPQRSPGGTSGRGAAEPARSALGRHGGPPAPGLPGGGDARDAGAGDPPAIEWAARRCVRRGTVGARAHRPLGHPRRGPRRRRCRQLGGPGARASTMAVPSSTSI